MWVQDVKGADVLIYHGAVFYVFVCGVVLENILQWNELLKKNNRFVIKMKKKDKMVQNLCNLIIFPNLKKKKIPIWTIHVHLSRV